MHNVTKNADNFIVVVTCLVPILKEAKQLLMAAEKSHLLSVDKIAHEMWRTV